MQRDYTPRRSPTPCVFFTIYEIQINSIVKSCLEHLSLIQDSNESYRIITDHIESYKILTNPPVSDDWECHIHLS
jgi:hypothetical protein